MNSDAIQITIPDFDEDFQSTPIPFGRSGGNAFGAFGNTGSGPESPTLITPIALPERIERGYFHSRGDSVTSEDSIHSQSTRHVAKPFAHSSQSSVATTSSSPFTKKPSFASIRNAFKITVKSSDVPPLPQIDHQAYPILKNPFNRSTSSLAHAPTISSQKPSFTTSPPHPRAPTPGASESRPRAASRARGHSVVKSQHSHNGSIFHSSDTGSDLGHGFGSSSPPPVPRMPGAFGGQFGKSEVSLITDEDDKIVMDPKTPSDYALHAVFIRFATLAEAKIESFLRESLDRDCLLSDFLGPNIDPKFDGLLISLGKIAQKHTKPVIDSVMRWRKSQNESVSSHILRHHLTQSPTLNRSMRQHEVSFAVNERKSLASIYIMCRALVAVLQLISKDALGESLGWSLEETTFDQFKKPDLKLLAQSANHRINADLFATLLGHLANVRFVSVTDRFLGELNPVAMGQVAKDLDTKYENLVKGLRHIQIKVWPPEAFEEGAEFMESLSKSFENTHGLRFKTTFAETLTRLLHSIGKTAQAEVNHPQWAKAIEKIFPRARDMMGKPRYWNVAYPLTIACLCVAPHQFFLRNWMACFEAGLSKLKEKPHRLPVMNGMMRLIWTYLYRCQEPASTTTSKLESLMKHFFPTNRPSVFPHEEHLEPFVYTVHFVLSRHFDYGSDFCLELMQEFAIRASPTQNIPNILAPERLAISVQAILLTLAAIEREEPNPTWPSSTDFFVVPPQTDYPSSSDILPQAILSKPGMQDFFDRCGVVLTAIARYCSSTVGQMSIFDEQWSSARFNLSHEESPGIVIRRHPEAIVAYPSYLASQINMLQTCFQSWPRCLHSSLPLQDAVDMLIHGVVHVEPRLGEIAIETMKRFIAEPQSAVVVLSRFTTFLFDPSHVVREGSGMNFALESVRLLEFWSVLVDSWINDTIGRQKDLLSDDDRKTISLLSDELSAGALFLLSHETRSIHSSGVKVIRMLRMLSGHIGANIPEVDGSTPSSHIADLLHGKGIGKTYFEGYDELLDRSELDRLQQWRESTRTDVLLRLADSSNEKDRKLWRHVFPAFMQICIHHSVKASNAFRDTLVAASSRYHPVMLHLAGLLSRAPTGVGGRAPFTGEKDGYRVIKEHMHTIDQWHMWIKILCATTAVSDGRSAMTNVGREHSRVPSDSNFERERMMTARHLFRYLTPFLDSDYTPFRDAAVLCINSFPSGAYPTLLEDLGSLASRQFYNETRPKAGSSTPIGRTRRQDRLHSAVARIYYLTADLLPRQRSAAKQAALSHVLKFVRSTQLFLAENRENYALQRLRRYFCGTVERLFDGLANLIDSERFIPPNMHLTLYRLCEEWCQYGHQSDAAKHRFIIMQRASAAAANDPQAESDAAERFQHETKLLSSAAVGALASLCQKAYFPPEVSSSSPTERPSMELLKPLEASSTLERIGAIFATSNPQMQARGRKALRSLLLFPKPDAILLDETLRRAFVGYKELLSGSALFFEIVSDIICTTSEHGFTYSQVVTLGLSNLCHTDPGIRRNAFNILETIHERSFGILSMTEFESLVGSSAPSTYLHAHHLISDCLAGEHPTQAINVLSHLATWLPRIHSRGSHRLSLLLLQSLEGWVQNIQLLQQDESGVSRISSEGRTALYHMVSLTQRHGDSHPEQIAAIWTRFVDSPHQANGLATITFLVEKSQKVATTAFIKCAAHIVACLSRTAIGRQIFEQLCSIIEPERMLPNIDHKLGIPDAEEVELWSDLDILFAEDQPKLSLGSAQYAMLFIADVALDRQWTMHDQIPVLLHAIFSHLDHRILFVRQQAQHMLFQLIRSCIPAYAELNDRSVHVTRSTLKSTISALEQGESVFWNDDDTNEDAGPKMKQLCSQVVSILNPITPELLRKWGKLALAYGTTCAIRPIAFRSLQLYRILMPPMSQDSLGQLLARLSATISATDVNIQLFTNEIVLTLIALASTEELDRSLLPQLFWTTHACLSTAIESEFTQVLKLLTVLLTRINLDDPAMVDLIMSQRPLDWKGYSSLQSSLLAGLRSSTTVEATFKSFKSLGSINDSRLIDSTEGRLRDLYTVSLPWCLHAMANDSHDESLNEFAYSIARLADREGRDSISRIMTSFVKNRFRTKDDFLRQSVLSLREHYGVDHWTEIATLLLGLVLNRERWLRVHSMQVLKIFFQQRESRSLMAPLGSELLMPLLRLVESDLSSQALEVLEEPMTIAGGPAAKHILRMSMHMSMLTKGTDNVTDVFGVPEDSGWCVAQPDTLRQQCRFNITAIFETCKVSYRPSMIEFEPEAESLAVALSDGLEEDLGGLVQDLHELSRFFQNPRSHTPVLVPSQQLEARVAAILAKSRDTVTDVPQTPFVDVFKVGRTHDISDDSDDDSDNESEFDAFIFDSPSLYRSAPNGHTLR
ncbi:hypothetical protein SERLA73DRAFT_69422 [Serpula lacrymans var. lacrymans S7.3]|uniref:Cell morphogenesis protein n=2 Tax=Serpula lacrymans var. lacrymans TaxID=341189 RepID=F8PKM0_SERL3|nr:uncharacterized protein SERLADRAFT_433373 [Serpula lacrymans var. lacrymans S7.9]EGO03567.1 hypothetical protein SERLA73DRAFT_69422 [Serpula lacrymans var. lacrymans S7.3]EGO29387.1 hypothetical protein SERLADRAFT_433373 [Serpula lacrymans var. lacrymans S7.9]